MSCPTIKTAAPISSCNLRSVNITSRCTTTSNALVGSSAIITFGPNDTAMAIATRCFIPPLNSCGYIRDTAGSRPTLRRTSTIRSEISDPLMLSRWSLNPLAIWLPTLITGFSEFMAP